MVGRIIAVTGPPCSGKSTYANEQATRHGGVYLSTGKLIREQNDHRVDRVLMYGGMHPINALVDDYVMTKAEAMTSEQLLVVDGWPRFQTQVSRLASHRHEMRAVHVAMVLAPSAVCLERAKRRHVDSPPWFVAAHEARAALWFARQHHEIIQALSSLDMPFEVVDGTESQR